MIKRINIGKLGPYRDFYWKSITDKGNNVIELKKENIFYGRNYSGKTTLSRIVQALEIKEISSKYDNPKFEVILKGNKVINEMNLWQSDLLIRCFNKDFINKNLKFIIDPDSDIVPFAILGENSEIEQKIKEIKEELGDDTPEKETKLYKELSQLNESKQNLQDQKEKIQKKLETELVQQATSGPKSIKKQHRKFGDINYNIKKLKTDIKKVLDPGYVPINSEKELENLKIIEEQIKDRVLWDFNLDLNYDKLFKETKKLTESPLVEAGKIEELLSNPRLNKWVTEGYDLHNENRECSCKFCGSPITHSRWEELDNHFDEQSRELKRSLLKLKESIQEEVKQVQSLVLPKDSFFYHIFQREYMRLYEELNIQIHKYIGDLHLLINKVEKRLNSILEKEILNVEKTFQKELMFSLKKEMDALVLKNNEYSENLNSAISQAQEELRLLEVKKFIERTEYRSQINQLEDKNEDCLKTVSSFSEVQELILKKEKRIEELSRQLKNEEEGARKVNFYLQNYFGHQDLTLRTVEEERDSEKKIRFNIERGGKLAHHLSEGECSLISFCYFMAKLDDIHTAGRKPIIFIDDPISSLDSNHIFFVYSLINGELFQKNRFEQIFISTHNLDFLKYLKRLKFTRNENEHFLINRYRDFSTIIPMPRYLKDYVTEFNYLFDQIYKCATVDIASDDNHYLFYNFGNNARKFLEALLFYKYPSRIDGQANNASSRRLLKYFGDDNQSATLTDRVNNELSHLEEVMDRGMRPIDVPEIKKVAQFILDKMKENDPDQYEALLESIGAKTEVLPTDGNTVSVN